MKFKHFLIVVSVGLVFILSSCTRNQMVLFQSLSPAQKSAVVNWLRSPSPDCYTAIAKHWPGDKAWARKIVSRESTNNPRAVNGPHRGCWQMNVNLHAHRFAAVGCAGNYFSADCNTKAAWNLYVAAGPNSWTTNY